MEGIDRISRNPSIMTGKPIIRGMRITVGMVVGLVAAGHSFESILEAYPSLHREDIAQALRYAAMLASSPELALAG